jgi:hypothetical protein
MRGQWDQLAATGKRGDYPARRRERTDWGAELAWLRTVVLACWRIWARVREAVSAAKSVSRMALSAALEFSRATPRLFTVLWMVYFWNAPSLPRSWETVRMAVSRTRWARTSWPELRELGAPLAREERKPSSTLPREAVETDWIPMEALLPSVTLEPRPKVAPPPVMKKLLEPPFLLARERMSNSTSRSEVR